jgi:hypothetical protein
MKIQPNSLDQIIGGKEKNKEVLLLEAPLPTILVGNRGMLPLIAHGKKRFKKW